jgi:DNA-binding CsgD family transcriptional regulator
LFITPTRRAPNPLGETPLALVSVVDPELGSAEPTERLRAYFGLTRTEARVAAELVAGLDAREIADRLGMALNTTRLHIAHLLSKSGTNRQGEFIALASRLRRPT